MPANYNELHQAITDLTEEVAATETLEESATTLIYGFAAAQVKAVTDALAADNIADQSTINAVVTALNEVRDRFIAAGKPLSEAIVANLGSV